MTTFILVAAAVCWMLFYFMDRHWYHRLLRGAVNHGLSIEKRVEATWPELGLAKAIGEASPFIISARKIGPFNLKEQRLGTDFKMAVFYWAICLLLVAGAVITFIDQAPAPSTSRASKLGAGSTPRGSQRRRTNLCLGDA